MSNNIFNFFRSSFVQTNLLNSFNSLINSIKWKFDNEKINEVEEFGSKFGNDFKDSLINIYSHKLKSADAKELALSKSSGKLNISREEFFKLFDAITDENIKQFISFMFASPKLIYEKYSKEYEQENLFGNELFDTYLKIKVETDDLRDVLFDKFSIADCFLNPNVNSNILTTFDVEKISNADLFWSTIELNMEYGKVTGNNNQITSFERSIEIMKMIAPVWNQLKVSSEFGSESENISNVTVNKQPNLDQVISVYRGNYYDVPNDYPQANEIAYNLISNYANFNKLSNSRKLQVSNYLINNRSVFNNALAQSAKIISDLIESECENPESIDFGNNKFAVKAFNKIRNSYSSIKSYNLKTKINFIVSFYLPMINSYQSKLMNSKTRFSKVNSKILNIDSSVPETDYDDYYDDDYYDDYYDDEYYEPEQKKSPNYYPDSTSKLNMYGGVNELINLKIEQMTEDELVNELGNAQKEFNKKYEELYREMVRNIGNITLPSIYKEQVSNLYPYCKLFDDIAIKNPKTSYRISGYYSKNSVNAGYRKLINDTIFRLKTSKISSFVPVINTLEKMENLLIESASNARSLRMKFLKSPRNSVGLMARATLAVKIPCELKQKDFILYDEAIKRLYWQIRNNSSESTFFNNKDEIKKYIELSKDRSAFLKKQFEMEKMNFQYELLEKKIRNPNQYREIKFGIMDEIQNGLIYINDVLEPQLVKLKENYDKMMTTEQLRKIENSYMMFRSSRIGEDFQNQIMELDKSLRKNADIFTIANQIKKILNTSGYFQFIELIYKELNIFPSDFNWEEFSSKLMNLIVFSNLTVNISKINGYITFPCFDYKKGKFNDKKLDLWVYELLIEFIETLIKKTNPGSAFNNNALKVDLKILNGYLDEVLVQFDEELIKKKGEEDDEDEEEDDEEEDDEEEDNMNGGDDDEPKIDIKSQLTQQLNKLGLDNCGIKIKSKPFKSITKDNISTIIENNNQWIKKILSNIEESTTSEPSSRQFERESLERIDNTYEPRMPFNENSNRGRNQIEENNNINERIRKIDDTLHQFYEKLEALERANPNNNQESYKEFQAFVKRMLSSYEAKIAQFEKQLKSTDVSLDESYKNSLEAINKRILTLSGNLKSVSDKYNSIDEIKKDISNLKLKLIETMGDVEYLMNPDIYNNMNIPNKEETSFSNGVDEDDQTGYQDTNQSTNKDVTQTGSITEVSEELEEELKPTAEANEFFSEAETYDNPISTPKNSSAANTLNPHQQLFLDTITALNNQKNADAAKISQNLSSFNIRQLPSNKQGKKQGNNQKGGLDARALKEKFNMLYLKLSNNINKFKDSNYGTNKVSIIYDVLTSEIDFLNFIEKHSIIEMDGSGFIREFLNKLLKINNLIKVYYENYQFMNSTEKGGSLNNKYIVQLINPNEHQILYTLFKNNNSKWNLIIQASFESLTAQALGIIDKYWSMKYQGKLNIPIGINNILQGGSVFDNKSFHDNSNAKIIPEAVPFYIIGLNILSFYISKLQSSDQNIVNNITSEIKISKLSQLHQVFKMFTKYHMNLSNISISQLTTIVNIFNEIWDQLEGSNIEKLSSGIDFILNELNASMIVSNVMEKSLMDFGISNGRFSMISPEESIEIIKKIYQSALVSNENFDIDQQNIHFEKLLHNSLVKIRETPENQRLIELRNMISSSTDIKNSNLDNYYKLMDLVIVPLIMCYSSYQKIALVFKIIIRSYTSLKDLFKEKFDLNEEIIKIGGDDVPVWECIKDKDASDEEKINLFDGNRDIVKKYNNYVINDIILNYLVTGEMKLIQKLWIPDDIDSYPTKRVFEYKTKIDKNIDKLDVAYSIQYQNILKIIFPEIKSNRLQDYYDIYLARFKSDVDACIHLLMSFPYFDDNIINNIRSNLHDEIGNLTQTIEFEAKDFRDIQLKFNFEPPKVEFKFLNNYLLGISDTKQISGIPEYDEKDILEQAEIHKEWVYWVIENIANLNYDFTIPFKLLDLLVQNPHFNKYLQFKVYKQDKSSDFTVDNRFTVDDKAVPFLIQQCLARSSTEKNKAISEFSVYGENYINNIITIIPYLLSVLYVVQECDKNKREELNDLIGILTHYYNEILIQAQPIKFLQSSSYNKDHLIGEILGYRNAQIQTLKDKISVLDWANKYKFIYLNSITFPEFKNSDRFEWINKYAEDLFKFSVFKDNFEVIKSNMGIHFWNIVMINSWSDNQPSRMFNLFDFNSQDFRDKFTKILSNLLFNDKKVIKRLNEPGLLGGTENNSINNYMKIIAKNKEFDEFEKFILINLIYEDDSNIINQLIIGLPLGDLIEKNIIPKSWISEIEENTNSTSKYKCSLDYYIYCMKCIMNILSLVDKDIKRYPECSNIVIMIILDQILSCNYEGIKSCISDSELLNKFVLRLITIKSRIESNDKRIMSILNNNGIYLYGSPEMIKDDISEVKNKIQKNNKIEKNFIQQCLNNPVFIKAAKNEYISISDNEIIQKLLNSEKEIFTVDDENDAIPINLGYLIDDQLSTYDAKITNYMLTNLVGNFKQINDSEGDSGEITENQNKYYLSYSNDQVESINQKLSGFGDILSSIYDELNELNTIKSITERFMDHFKNPDNDEEISLTGYLCLLIIYYNIKDQSAIFKSLDLDKIILENKYNLFDGLKIMYNYYLTYRIVNDQAELINDFAELLKNEDEDEDEDEDEVDLNKLIYYYLTPYSILDQQSEKFKIMITSDEFDHYLDTQGSLEEDILLNANSIKNKYDKREYLRSEFSKFIDILKDKIHIIKPNDEFVFSNYSDPQKLLAFNKYFDTSSRLLRESIKIDDLYILPKEKMDVQELKENYHIDRFLMTCPKQITPETVETYMEKIDKFIDLDSNSKELIYEDLNKYDDINLEETILNTLHSLMHDNFNKIDYTFQNNKSSGFLLTSLKGGKNVMDLSVELDKLDILPIDRLHTIYGSKNYMNLFKGVLDMGSDKFDNSTALFKFAMDYFHKKNIKFGGVMNSLIYGNILTNSVVFDQFVNKIQNLINTNDDTFNYKSTSQQILPIVISYLDNFHKTYENQNLLQKLKDAIYYINEFKVDASTIYLKSINVNFDYEMIYRYCDKNNKKEGLINRPFALDVLTGSTLFRDFYKLGLLATYIQMIIILVHQTSYYDSESEMELPFSRFSVDRMNPFTRT